MPALSGPLMSQPLGPGTAVPNLGVSAPGAGGADGHAQERRVLL